MTWGNDSFRRGHSYDIRSQFGVNLYVLKASGRADPKATPANHGRSRLVELDIPID